jgi:hypothetical protein
LIVIDIKYKGIKLMADTYDIMVNGEKKGVVPKRNPVAINTDAECMALLESFKKDLPLSYDEVKLVDNAIAVIDANNNDDVNFGPIEFVQLAQMGTKHHSKTLEIMACSDHLIESMDFEVNFSGAALLGVAEAYLELDALTGAADEYLDLDDLVKASTNHQNSSDDEE